ncbi:hypothetical protein [Patiriisocius sp. Uisw_017]|uniref:hypothetical protein n=1 Tax=Patiriisocius sp. Uisw_017 TaxID=3230968 RepID=UPI0039EA3C77
MKFDKVNLEHINLAINDFKEKGFPEGFKQSAYLEKITFCYWLEVLKKNTVFK